MVVHRETAHDSTKKHAAAAMRMEVVGAWAAGHVLVVVWCCCCGVWGAHVLRGNRTDEEENTQRDTNISTQTKKQAM